MKMCLAKRLPAYFISYKKEQYIVILISSLKCNPFRTGGNLYYKAEKIE